MRHFILVLLGAFLLSSSAPSLQVHASFDDDTVFHIIIPGSKPNTPITIHGKLSAGYINNIAVWQIENNNGTGECAVRLREFTCTATSDPLMDVEITIDYTPTLLQGVCEYLPTQLELTAGGSSSQVFLQDHAYPRPNCVLLPLLAR